LSDRCSEGETYTWSASPGTVTFTPSSGAATSAVFPTIGDYTVTVTAQNPYMSTSITKTLAVTVTTDGSLPFTMLDGAYGIVGPVCLDAKGTRGTQSVDAYNARVDAFASPADYTKTYRFIHNNAYSNLNLILLDPAGLVERVTSPAPDGTDADKEEPFTLTFKSNIKTRVPSNGDSLTVKLIATYMNNGGLPRVAYLEIRVEDGTCICPAKIDADTWLNFMCHNLGGIDIISSAQLITREHHGDWYRFGAKQTSMKNTSAHDTDNTWDNPNYYTLDGDWPADSVPCPAGWRLPTITELAPLINKNTSGNTIPVINPLTDVPDPWQSAINSPFSNLKKSGDYLYLPIAGFRLFTNFTLNNRGAFGYYWSSTGSSNARNLLVNSKDGTSLVDTSNRGYGYSVRCVQAE
jgi:uncharacterized protein (TIGR02145 family)